MSRSWHIWIAFGLCLAVVLVAMGWISLKALRLEGAEIEARRQAARARREAALEQDVQLALYRMEFALTPLVALESARPYFVYNTFLPVDPSRRQAPDAQPGPGVAISPLVTEASPDVLLHFQFEPDGRLTSPRVPDPAKRSLVVPGHLSGAAVEEAQSRLTRLAAAVDRSRLLARLPDGGSEPSPLAVNMAQIPQQLLLNEQFQADVRQQGRAFAEFNRR